MTQHISLLLLTLAISYQHPAVGFSLCRSPAASSSSKCSATQRRNRAASAARARIPPSRCGQIAPPSAGRRRRPLSALSAATDEPAAGAAAQVDEAAGEPPTGCERAPHEPAVQAFEGWTARAGCRGSSGSLSHADFDGLPGLMTKVAVPPWQPIATVPESLFLREEFLFVPCSPTAAASDAGAAAGTERTQRLPPPPPLSVEAWQRCPWWVRLGVRLLKERADGEGSRLQEYVGMLPRPGETGAPLNWSAEQLDRLYYPRLLSQIKIQRRLFEGFRKVLLADARRGDNAPSTREGDCVNRLVSALADPAMFSWALECVLSRAFQLPPRGAAALVVEEGDDVPVKAPEVTPPAPDEMTMALLPLIDSINHYSRMPTHMYWEADGALSLSVGAAFDPGDHAFASYGPVSNDDLLQYYGFVERDNPSDTYVLEDMGKWLREDGLLGADLSSRLLACPAARNVWRYLRRGVILRDAVHPATMQAVRIVACEAAGLSAGGESELSWDGTEADLSRFTAPISLASENAAFELLMRYSAREADDWGKAGVAAALAEDPAAPGLDGDLDGLGLDTDRRLMLSVFRLEKIALLRGIVGRLTHMRKVSDLLNRPIKMPVSGSPPPVLGPACRSS
ncbi:unnamed protein product [Ectocarpus sp. CCAP 1310/34]|nr:unnamed protein product [Ectocarpus sp. CCAP 1310/34]